MKAEYMNMVEDQKLQKLQKLNELGWINEESSEEDIQAAIQKLNRIE